MWLRWDHQGTNTFIEVWETFAFLAVDDGSPVMCDSRRYMLGRDVQSTGRLLHRKKITCLNYTDFQTGTASRVNKNKIAVNSLKFVPKQQLC